MTSEKIQFMNFWSYIFRHLKFIKSSIGTSNTALITGLYCWLNTRERNEVTEPVKRHLFSEFSNAEFKVKTVVIPDCVKRVL